MSLQTKIENKLNEALKAKDKETYSTLRLVVAAIKDGIIAKKISFFMCNLSVPDYYKITTVFIDFGSFCQCA